MKEVYCDYKLTIHQIKNQRIKYILPQPFLK